MSDIMITIFHVQSYLPSIDMIVLLYWLFSQLITCFYQWKLSTNDSY